MCELLLLTRLRDLWAHDGLPTVESRVTLLATFAAEISRLGPANFLYSDGDALFAFGDRRIQRPGGKTEAPGLWMLARRCTWDDPLSHHQAGVSIGQGAQDIVLIASVPLTDEAWQPFNKGELLVVQSGQWVTTGQHQ